MLRPPIINPVTLLINTLKFVPVSPCSVVGTGTKKILASFKKIVIQYFKEYNRLPNRKKLLSVFYSTIILLLFCEIIIFLKNSVR